MQLASPRLGCIPCRPPGSVQEKVHAGPLHPWHSLLSGWLFLGSLSGLLRTGLWRFLPASAASCVPFGRCRPPATAAFADVPAAGETPEACGCAVEAGLAFGRLPVGAAAGLLPTKSETLALFLDFVGSWVMPADVADWRPFVEICDAGRFRRDAIASRLPGNGKRVLISRNHSFRSSKFSAQVAGGLSGDSSSGSLHEATSKQNPHEVIS